MYWGEKYHVFLLNVGEEYNSTYNYVQYQGEFTLLPSTIYHERHAAKQSTEMPNIFRFRSPEKAENHSINITIISLNISEYEFHSSSSKSRELLQSEV